MSWRGFCPGEFCPELCIMNVLLHFEPVIEHRNFMEEVLIVALILLTTSILSMLGG